MFLACRDQNRAAASAGLDGSLPLLQHPAILAAIEELRSARAEQLRREDIVGRLADIAFARPNDCVRLAIGRSGDLDALDLTLLQEIKVSDKGVELRLIDRLQALRLLAELQQETVGGSDLLAMLGGDAP